MLAFDYIQPATIDAAVSAAKNANARYIGGGTNLVDLMKAGVEQPMRLIDVNRLQLDAIAELPGGGLRLGAAARNADVANHVLVRQRYPLLSRALLAGASPQLRNMATVGGNLMQRTRCDYFVDIGFAHCNKRNPGSGCAARDGYNRGHAILGASTQCVAVNPSDMSVALLALNAIVRVRGTEGEREIPIADFHRLPGENPQRDTNLKAGELIVAVDLPPSQFAQNYHYLKIRERASFAFALVSVAVGLELKGGSIRDARVALGGVAHKPWLVQDAGALLAGKPPHAAGFHAVATAALKDARPLAQNAYKVALARNAIVRALRLAAGEGVA
jgi:xanthine dehydrogenase YagS FAD-binding subunit